MSCSSGAKIPSVHANLSIVFHQRLIYYNSTVLIFLWQSVMLSKVENTMYMPTAQAEVIHGQAQGRVRRLALRASVKFPLYVCLLGPQYDRGVKGYPSTLRVHCSPSERRRSIK